MDDRAKVRFRNEHKTASGLDFAEPLDYIPQRMIKGHFEQANDFRRAVDHCRSSLPGANG